MKNIILIGGATASGKSSMAMRVAQKLDCAIIGADSRQVYREMNIGTAKPSLEDRALVPHYLVDYISVEEPYDVARWERDALSQIEQLHQEYVIVCGGTGFYLKTLMYGIDDMPKVSKEIRLKVQNLFDTSGFEGLQKYISVHCPTVVDTDNYKNPQRLERAVQIHMQTGHCITHFQKNEAKVRPFHFIKLKTELSRDILYQRINQRVDHMMDIGLLDEVKSLYSKRHLRALRSVGYQELFQYLDDEMDLEYAIEKIKQHTRNYAKRQLTWFRNQDTFQAVDPKMADSELMELIKKLSRT